ncbi:unnamed protein product [Moneuplotes crassus]|uniref:Uncharacterized protein n=1 Tax=Euplotes crassus TaxID=5936 RepID=A0AAD1XVK7_EUPCR|nr:unnamed protein product [Moneuplotes crassus]
MSNGYTPKGVKNSPKSIDLSPKPTKNYRNITKNSRGTTSSEFSDLKQDLHKRDLINFLTKEKAVLQQKYDFAIQELTEVNRSFDKYRSMSEQMLASFKKQQQVTDQRLEKYEESEKEYTKQIMSLKQEHDNEIHNLELCIEKLKCERKSWVEKYEFMNEQYEKLQKELDYFNSSTNHDHFKGSLRQASGQNTSRHADEFNRGTRCGWNERSGKNERREEDTNAIQNTHCFAISNQPTKSRTQRKQDKIKELKNTLSDLQMSLQEIENSKDHKLEKSLSEIKLAKDFSTNINNEERQSVSNEDCVIYNSKDRYNTPAKPSFNHMVQSKRFNFDIEGQTKCTQIDPMTISDSQYFTTTQFQRSVNKSNFSKNICTIDTRKNDQQDNFNCKELLLNKMTSKLEATEKKNSNLKKQKKFVKKALNNLTKMLNNSKSSVWDPKTSTMVEDITKESSENTQELALFDTKHIPNTPKDFCRLTLNSNIPSTKNSKKDSEVSPKPFFRDNLDTTFKILSNKKSKKYPWMGPEEQGRTEDKHHKLDEFVLHSSPMIKR